MNKQSNCIADLREKIAAALESGCPHSVNDDPFDRFEDLFSDGRRLPPVGLHYDCKAELLIASSFARAFKSPIYIPFNFEMDWSSHRSGSAGGCAKEHLLLMASMVRQAMLPTVEDALAGHRDAKSAA